ncbi:hypothetical protein PGB28_20440 [Primorskyibacter aestuariivivens]|uniref:hypothetical protein n=1 Tax=Primorskyibacter aestuariivivens TaxID=1888912 RepID=UPI002300AA2C|nr:hypothetical protein [Primorskyibacter aestuariivivens]MDA7430837.1 hypothetical protein [Primorskyibacter aestuariivivens]
MRSLLLRLAATLPVALGLGQIAGATTLDYAFLPPAVEQQDLCGGPRNAKPDDLSTGQRQDRLTDKERIRFLNNDIRRYQTENPSRHFRFVTALIDRLSSLDENFDSNDARLAKIGLYLDAGRFAALQEAGLVDQLVAQRDDLNYAQQMRVAQFLLSGIGTAQNIDLAHEIIREAGFAGNADALLFLARKSLDQTPVEGWDAPVDLTVTMAFGGLLGQMDGAVCRRAMRIAEEYLSGGLVSRNEDIALAWFRFAADLGHPEAAWRVVEHYLTAAPQDRDPHELQRYLEWAVDRGITLTDAALAQLKPGTVMNANELRALLGPNVPDRPLGTHPPMSRLVQLSVNIDSLEASEGGPYLSYLREISQLDGAPGAVFTDLAKEIFVRRGRWAGEAEAMPFLVEAARRDDPEGMRILAERLIRQRRDPVMLNRAADLLMDAGTRLGDAQALADLDKLFRCQAPDAPRLQEADHWARAYKASGHQSVQIGASDLVALDRTRDPWTLAELQTQALQRRPGALSAFLLRVQDDPIATLRAKRAWADRADNSDKTMEEFAKLVFETNRSPAERRAAVEFFRRVYVNNGVTTALDLAIALVEDAGRNPDVADEILRLLQQAGNRGEGAAIRLLARLTGSEAETYRSFADIIEARGDFLAKMFALPHVPPEKQDSYFDRAVALMACTTKDVAELGEARAILDQRDKAFHWRKVGLSLEGGHVLAKLRLSDRQMADYRAPEPPATEVLVKRAREAGGAAEQIQLFRLTANPELASYDPDAAARHFAEIVAIADVKTLNWALDHLTTADPQFREALQTHLDLVALAQRSAEAGIPAGMELYAGILMQRNDLRSSLEWLRRAAEAGRVSAMADLGLALAMAKGTDRDLNSAATWLDKAARGGHGRAAHLLKLLDLEE